MEFVRPDYYPTDPVFKKWAHEQGSISLGDQKVFVRTKNESAVESLREAVEKLLLLPRLQVPALLRKTPMSTNRMESMVSLVRHSEWKLNLANGSTMVQRWLGTMLFACEGRFRRVKDYFTIAHAMVISEAGQAEPQPASIKKAA